MNKSDPQAAARLITLHCDSIMLSSRRSDVKKTNSVRAVLKDNYGTIQIIGNVQWLFELANLSGCLFFQMSLNANKQEENGPGAPLIKSCQWWVKRTK